VKVGSNPAGIAFDGVNMWVGETNGSSTVTKIQASTGKILGTFTSGTSPGNLGFDGANIWAANEGAGTVSKL